MEFSPDYSAARYDTGVVHWVTPIYINKDIRSHPPYISISSLLLALKKISPDVSILVQ